VTIQAEQRLETGYRAADSYARAELLRFLSTRVVAILTDSLTGDGDQVLREHVVETATGMVDDWIVTGRYWEKRGQGDDAQLHIWSRLEVDKERVREMLSQATTGVTDLRLPATELLGRLDERWEKMQEVAELSDAYAVLPAGVSVPVWAQAGDTRDDQEFSFVCQATGSSEQEARAFAQARCNEKLCRLFGVKITAKTSVTETLDGIAAESEVSEQCEEVRAEGRKTRNQSTECSDEGCVHWARQTYPKAAYLAERKRLEQPNVVRQQVVIQEGDKKYRDPAACEAALDRYEKVAGLSAAAYEMRARELNAALRNCQDIDARDSGLFSSLNLRLTRPLDNFIFVNGRGESGRASFSAVDANWRHELDTERFITGRIQMVLAVVQDAIFPMKLFDATEWDRPKQYPNVDFEALVQEAIEYPFAPEPVRTSHRASVHHVLLGAFYNGKRPSKRYREFLLTQLGSGRITCIEPRGLSTGAIVSYLANDGTFDDSEYDITLKVLTRAPSRSMQGCVRDLLNEATPEAARNRRVMQIADLVARGKLAELQKDSKSDQWLPISNTSFFHGMTWTLRPEEKLQVYLKHRLDLKGEAKSKQLLADHALDAAYGRNGAMGLVRKDDEHISRCRSLPKELPSVLKQAPEFDIEHSSTCLCLEVEEISAGDRKALVELWLSATNKTCRYFKPDERPGGDFTWPSPQRRWPKDNNRPFKHAPQLLRSEYKDCGYEADIHSLDFTPLIHATLTYDRISKVRIQTQVDGTLSRMSFRGDRDEWVTREEVKRATERFDACFKKAAEGYVVPEDQLESKSTAARPIWLEFGDQGVSSGFGE